MNMQQSWEPACTPFILTVGGGSATATEGAWLTHLSSWKNASNDVGVIMVVRGEKSREIAREGNFKMFSIRAWRPSRSIVVQTFARVFFHEYAPNVLLNMDDMLFALKCRLTLRVLIERCLRVHSYSFWFSLMTLHPKSLRDKSIYTESSGDWVELSRGSGSLLAKIRYGMLGRGVLNRITVLVETKLNQNAMVSCGVKVNRIKLVRYEPGDLGTFKPSTGKVTNPFTILYVGRIVPQKGVHTLIEAADILVNERNHRNLRFLCVGPGAGFGIGASSRYYESLIDEVHSKDLEGVVRFEGYVDIQTLVDLYSSAMVLVLPSNQEAWGWVALEAMMCGTTSIVTSACGIAEIVDDGTTGFVVPPADAHSLADKLEFLLNNQGECLKMGVHAREQAINRYNSRSYSSFLEALTGSLAS